VLVMLEDIPRGEEPVGMVLDNAAIHPSSA
jgi:hypothetical protein